MTLEERRKQAWERVVLAFGVGAMLALLDAFGVEFTGGWIVIRWVALAILAVALVAFLVALWREWRARRRARSAPGRPARS